MKEINVIITNSGKKVTIVAPVQDSHQAVLLTNAIDQFYYLQADDMEFDEQIMQAVITCSVTNGKLITSDDLETHLLSTYNEISTENGYESLQD